MHRFTSLFRLNGSFFANKTLHRISVLHSNQMIIQNLCSCYLPCYLFSFTKTKAPETHVLRGTQGFSLTGDERIELPLRVLETPVIPFDQSPLFFYFYFFFLFSLTILRQHSATLYLYHTGIPLSIVFQFLFFTKESGSTATPSSPYLQNCIHSNPSWKFGCRFLSFFFSFSHSHRPLVKPSTD